MIRVRQLDHIVLRTCRVGEMIRFYQEVLGCTLERTLPEEVGLYQLRAGQSLIDIVDVDGELGRAGGGPPARTENNLDHFCLQLEAIEESDLRAWLGTHGIEPGDFERRYGAQGFGPSIYIKDPDGNTVELRSTQQSQPG